LLTLTVLGGGAPLEGAQVQLYARGLGRVVTLEGISDAAGLANFDVPPGYQAAVAVVSPRGDFWTMVTRGAQLANPIDCPPLPRDGPLGWWHQVLGQSVFDPQAGAGVRVGVADSGLDLHPTLAHAIGVGAFVDGVVTLGTAATVGTDPHGTHVAGTIGARPIASGDYAGLAPGCDLFAARVFPPGRGANQGDIAAAIDALSRDLQVDLINMSLGSPTPSEILHDAIIDAAERGTLCIAAAGNSAGPVGFPAAFDEVVAVAALGLEGWGPAGSLSSTRLPAAAESFGRDGLYFANFSCFGPQLDCCAPGVGIIATMPGAAGLPAPFGAMDGTSMASPVVCGAAAVLLSRSNAYLGLNRDSSRTAAARQILNGALIDVSLKVAQQGRGVPSL
jgi:subtilisin